MTVAEAARRSGISADTLRGRLHKGWENERLFEPTKGTAA